VKREEVLKSITLRNMMSNDSSYVNERTGMGATSEAHTVAEVVITNPSSRTRIHRPAEFVLAGIEIATEAALAAALSRVVLLSREDERQVPLVQQGLEADSDPPGSFLIMFAMQEAVVVQMRGG
jgi:hypothetical protein